MQTWKTTPKLCVQVSQTGWAVTLEAASLAYRAAPHTATGHTAFFSVTGQEVALPSPREWQEPALCRVGVTCLEALWKFCRGIMKAHEMVADDNARGAGRRVLQVVSREGWRNSANSGGEPR